MMYFRLSLLHLCCMFTCISAIKPNEFGYQRILYKSDSSQNELASFRIDNELYRYTKNDFSDLRLFNNEGQEVAYYIRYIFDNDTISTRDVVPVKLITFKKGNVSGANIEFTRNKNDALPEELFVETPIRNFEKKVSVFGSNDRKNWTLLTKDQLIFDYSRFIDFRNTTVHFDKKDYIYFNIVIDSISTIQQSGFSTVLLQSGQNVKNRYTEFVEHQEPFRLDEIRFYSSKKQMQYGNALQTQNELIINGSFTDTINNTTTVVLSSSREPVSKITVNVSGKNFYRQVAVFGTDDTAGDASWTQLASGELINIHLENFNQEHNEIDLHETRRFHYYKVVIQNSDNIPLFISSVKGEGPRHEVVFFHNGAGSLNVCYQSNNCLLPRYDIGTVLQKSPVTTGNLWMLGKSQIQDKQPENRSAGLSSRTILTVSLLLMVVILLIILFVAVKKVDAR